MKPTPDPVPAQPVAHQTAQSAAKRPYSMPVLHVYGDLRDITRGTGSKKPGDTKGMKTTSDPRVKTDVCRVGRHPLGVGLYLYRYRAEMQAHYGGGVYLGVMADELEQVLPEAVSVGSHGYRQVDYALIAPAFEPSMLND